MIRLGCIADDVTGATDLANNLVRAGLRVVQTLGVPEQDPGDVDAVVVALKSRTAPAAQAVAQSLQAADWLLRQGAQQLYFKVCSTFDSTAQGNIGPVTEALMDRLQATGCAVVPAFPVNGRTVYQGHLFVGAQLLSESPMRDHPLTPMDDANLLRVLQAQLAPEAQRRVGLVDLARVQAGAQAVRDRLQALQDQGQALAVCDTVNDADLHNLAQALAHAPLVVAGSGLALGLPAAWGVRAHAHAAALPPPTGRQAVLSGSCSSASNAQVAAFLASGGQARALDPLSALDAVDPVPDILAWAATQLERGPVLIYATASPDSVRAAQARLGVQAAGAWVEDTLARLAVGLVSTLGVRQLVVAGGETSGAVVQALDLHQLRVGGQIDPGVPWCHGRSTLVPDGLHLALKSGNFGRPEFFQHALEALNP